MVTVSQETIESFYIKFPIFQMQFYNKNIIIFTTINKQNCTNKVAIQKIKMSFQKSYNDTRLAILKQI